MPLNLMGPVASVFARTTTRVNPIEVEDCAVASLVMQSRALPLSQQVLCRMRWPAP